MIKHIIFDFDGTIVDSLSLSFNILNAFATKYGYKSVTMEDVHILKHAPVRERFKRINLPLYKIPKMTVDCMMMYNNQLHTLKSFEGIQSLLVGLKNEGLSLSIISSNAVDNITHFTNENQLNHFDNIISAKNLFGKDKTILKLAKQFKLKTDEILYIGDELRDVEACKKINVKVVAVTWGFDPLPLLERGNPDFIANHPDEILSIVKNFKKDVQ